jgi:hypothetical protein
MERPPAPGGDSLRNTAVVGYFVSPGTCFGRSQAMLSPLTANHRIAYIRCLSLNRTRNFASAPNGPLPKFARAMSELAPEPDETLEGGRSLATSLNHYFSLPPLPPTEDWVDRFPWGRLGCAVEYLLVLPRPLYA